MLCCRYGALEWQYPPHLRQGSYEEEGRSLNFLKAAISCADRVLTVSPGYANEIKTYLGGWVSSTARAGFVLAYFSTSRNSMWVA